MPNRRCRRRGFDRNWSNSEGNWCLVPWNRGSRCYSLLGSGTVAGPCLPGIDVTRVTVNPIVRKRYLEIVPSEVCFAVRGLQLLALVTVGLPALRAVPIEPWARCVVTIGDIRPEQAISCCLGPHLLRAGSMCLPWRAWFHCTSESSDAPGSP